MMERGKYYRRMLAMKPGYRFLLVEDDPTRVAWFRRQFPDCMIDHAATVPRAQRMILSPFGPYDGMFLDHDLGTEPQAGGDLARWLIVGPEFHPKVPIVVHSINAVSAPDTVMRLIDAGWEARWVPFFEMMRVHGP